MRRHRNQPQQRKKCLNVLARRTFQITLKSRKEEGIVTNYEFLKL